MKTDFSPVYPVYYEVFSEEQKRNLAKCFISGMAPSWKKPGVKSQV